MEKSVENTYPVFLFVNYILIEDISRLWEV